MIEIGAIRVENSQIVREMKTLLYPGMPIPEMITRLTGIKDDDVAGAPRFGDVAAELGDLIEGAVVVAHNARFDYAFLRQEFARIDVPFQARLLCTLRLSRALFPEHRRHSLQELINRFGIPAAARHRAYDDARAMWQFYAHCLREFDLDTIQGAVNRQWREASIPHQLDPKLVADLPESPGVYIFHDKDGPMYVGKAVNIRKRVLSHFASDHSDPKERKMATEIANITFIETAGELGALLLESDTIKNLRPRQNRKLQRAKRMIVASKELDENGYATLKLRDAAEIDPEETATVMGLFTTIKKAKISLQATSKNFYLCPKLLGLEKTNKACFLYQLHKCRGACAGVETAEDYNYRFDLAFEKQRIEEWPFEGPVIITERRRDKLARYLVDKWCLIGVDDVSSQGDHDTREIPYKFDRDIHAILRSFINNPRNARKIKPYSPAPV
jgi:DNA polymerase-3 subunit epsilon